MATIPLSSASRQPDWQSRTEVKKGNLAEQIVDAYLQTSGDFVPYAPICEGRHPFDRLVASRDKRKVFIADCKAKARRNYYPDTGIDVRHYEEYKEIAERYHMDAFLFFVDEKQRAIYGNFLSELEKPAKITVGRYIHNYPKREGRIIYFPLAHMVEVAKLTEDQARELERLSTRHYDYNLIPF